MRVARFVAAGFAAFLVALLLITQSASAAPLSREASLVWAARNKLPAVARMLLDAGANPDETDLLGNTPLHAAVKSIEIVKLLLERKASVDLRNELGETALHLAVRYPDTVTLLLAAGADRNARTALGKTPLDYCMEWGPTPGTLKTIELLLKS